MDLNFDWNGLQLAGTVAFPDGQDSASSPAVLLLQGSGAADRDCDGYFEPIRQAFLANGIATYSFDKPGCGTSTGDWRDYGIERRFEQAAAALQALSDHPRVTSDAVGVWGHSQGGWVVQQLASRLDRLALAIANSGPTIDVEAQNIYGYTQSLRTAGHTQTSVSAALGFMNELHEAARADQAYATVKHQLLDRAVGEPWYGYLTIEDEHDWRHMRALLAEPIDPVAALSAVRCPLLAIYGGLDLLVPPWRGAKQSGKALQQAPTNDSTVVVFPEGDHRIQEPTSGRFVAGYLGTIADWAAQRVRHQR